MCVLREQRLDKNCLENFIHMRHAMKNFVVNIFRHSKNCHRL